MPPRKRLKKTKLQADNVADSEKLTVVYIHGIGNKPEPSILKRQYDQALFGIDMGGRTRMAYWADIRYPQPLPSGDVEGLSVAFQPAATRLNDPSNVRRLAPQGPQAEQYAAAVASKLLKEVASSDRKRINRVGEKILPGFIRKPVVEWITKTFIEDTAAYFFDPEQRELMRQRLRQILQAQTGPYILVAHSQGSIIAYDVLREFDGQPDIFHILLFVTIGSPLGLAEVQDHLQKPLRIPKVVQQWQNFADLFDSVAADKKLSDDFTNGKQPSDQIVVNSDTVSISHFNPHSGTGYLSTSQVRQTVRDQMGAALITPITPFVIARDIAAEMADPTVRLSVLIELKDEGSDLQTARTELDKELRQMEKNFKKQLSPRDRKYDHYKIDPLRRYIAADLTAEEIDQLAARHQTLQIVSIWKDSEKRALLDKSTHVVQAYMAQLSYGASGKDIAWAILDTGIRADHPHFSAYKNIASQWDCTQVGPPVTGKAVDGDGHGTHVAGIIAGTGNNEHSNLKGMAPEVKLHIYKVLSDDGTGSDSWIIKALDHIASVNESSFDLVIHGINLSLGGPFDEAVFACGFSPICRELRRLWNQGVVVCIAAGNEGRLILDTVEGEQRLNLDLSIGDPANLEEAIAVGSVHKQYPHMYGISFFSSRGPTADGRVKPDVVAPGEKIMSSNAGFSSGQEYIALSGTSMASFFDFIKNGSRDKDVTPSILDWMDRAARNKKIAFLVEAGTGYGFEAGYGKASADYRSPETPTGHKKRECELEDKAILMSYPVHISQLRKASEKARVSEKGTTETPRARPRDLKLSLEEGDDPKDILPPFSQFETFSVELVLHNIFATIAKEDIRYVGLFSTDIRDQIFLANAIRRRAPNVVLFTVGADLLYLHSDVNVDFNGMLLITTYPLFNKNQIWTPPFKGEEFRIQFPNYTAQGVYNATLALLGKPGAMLEYGDPLLTNQEINAPRYPPVWLAVVGKDNIWPIKYFALLDSMGYVLQTNSDKKNNNDQGLYSKRLFYALCLLAFVCLLLSSVLILDSFTVSSNRFEQVKYIRSKLSGLFKLFGDTVCKELRYERRIHLFAFSVGVLMLSIIVSRLFSRYLVGSSSNTDVCDFRQSFNLFPLLGLGVPALIATVLVGWKTFYSADRSITAKGFGNKNLLLGFLLFLFMIFAPLYVLALSLSFATEICSLPKTDQLFLNLRMLNLGSGVSPLPPLFFIAGGGFLYLFCSLRRLRALEELQGVRPRITRRLILGFDGRSFTGLARLQTDVTYLLECSTFQLPFTWLVSVIVGVPCVYLFVFRLLPSIEVNSFYLFFGTAFLVVYMALALTLLRFLCVWWATRRILKRLEAHPIQASFKNLASGWTGMPRLDLSVSFNPFIPLDFSLTKATELSRRAVQAGSLQVHAEKAENFVRLALRAEEKSRWPKSMNFRRSAQTALSRAANSIGTTLEASWRVMPPGDKKREQWLKDARLYLAAQCVTFLLHVFSHLKNLISAVFVGLLLMLMAVNSYPFQPREWILWFNWSIILAAVISTMVVFVQINRDSILSHLSNTTPGRLSWTWDFITKTLVYGAVPLLALLSAQFPESLRQMVSWFGGVQGGH